MQIQPIRSDDDHRAALSEIEALWGAEPGTERGDQLDALVALVDGYETRRWPIGMTESFDPVDVLHFAIEEMCHSQAELARLLGSRSRASEILSRRRALTVAMIHDISRAWKMPAELLIKPYDLVKRAG
jgi:HTH-type transcriptional regulator/antitoxin HigA